MVDESRVKLMTKLAIYEQKEEHRAVPMSRFYRSDYVRYNVLKTMVAATVSYWSVFAVYIYMSFEDVLAKINDLDYFGIIYKLLGGYVLFCLAFFFLSSFVYGYRYEKAKSGLARYNGNLKKLIALEGGETDKKTVGVVVEEIESGEEQTEVSQAARTTEKPRVRVNRTELMRNVQRQEDREKEQQIIENVRKRNERIASQNEALLRQQKQAEADRQRIIERRKQLEREHIERVRAQQLQQMQRKNHTYSNQEGSDR